MSKGRFGVHGGQYIPKTLMNAINELEVAYDHYKNDPEFNRELKELLDNYAGRPSLLYYADKLSKELGGAKIYLKREDLNHTGSHKINNVLGQALLAKKWARHVLLQRQVQVSTELQQLRQLHFSTWTASFLWARRTQSVRHSMFTE